MYTVHVSPDSELGQQLPGQLGPTSRYRPRRYRSPGQMEFHQKQHTDQHLRQGYCQGRLLKLHTDL